MTKTFHCAALASVCALAMLLSSCTGKKSACMPDGQFIYNLPCKVVNIHQDKPGKSILFLWLHGGVHDTSMHDLFETNHLDCCAADDSVLNYLEKKGIKAIALFPVCHKAELDHPVAWKDCWTDVKSMIDDYVDKGLVDADRIYLAGSSDGGVGTWDYVEEHPEVFAVAMAQSCGRPRKTPLQVYFFNTASERDCTEQVKGLTDQGYRIQYKHCADKRHGGDAAECTEAFLDEFFSYVRK